MKFVAKPIEVDAFKIVSVAPCRMSDGSTSCKLEDGRLIIATPAMTARMDPKVGDYWVVQPDGYEYLNPRKVFESKYLPALLIADEASITAAEWDAANAQFGPLPGPRPSE